MRVSVEPERCVASGQCVMLAPAVFDQDDDGIVVLLRDEAGDEVEGVKESIRVCPARAIASSDSE